LQGYRNRRRKKRKRKDPTEVKTSSGSKIPGSERRLSRKKNRKLVKALTPLFGTKKRKKSRRRSGVGKKGWRGIIYRAKARGRGWGEVSVAVKAHRPKNPRLSDPESRNASIRNVPTTIMSRIDRNILESIRGVEGPEVGCRPGGSTDTYVPERGKTASTRKARTPASDSVKLLRRKGTSASSTDRDQNKKKRKKSRAGKGGPQGVLKRLSARRGKKQKRRP